MSWEKTDDVPNWLYNYTYWTMSPDNDFESRVLYLNTQGQFVSWYVYSVYNAAWGVDYTFNVVRPVIVLPKSAL